jgi:hypothetical protein
MARTRESGHIFCSSRDGVGDGEASPRAQRPFRNALAAKTPGLGHAERSCENLVCRGPFNAVNAQHLCFNRIRIQAEPKLLLQRREH